MSIFRSLKDFFIFIVKKIWGGLKSAWRWTSSWFKPEDLKKNNKSDPNKSKDNANNLNKNVAHPNAPTQAQQNNDGGLKQPDPNKSKDKVNTFNNNVTPPNAPTQVQQNNDRGLTQSDPNKSKDNADNLDNNVTHPDTQTPNQNPQTSRGTSVANDVNKKNASKNVAKKPICSLNQYLEKINEHLQNGFEQEIVNADTQNLYFDQKDFKDFENQAFQYCVFNFTNNRWILNTDVNIMSRFLNPDIKFINIKSGGKSFNFIALENAISKIADSKNASNGRDDYIIHHTNHFYYVSFEKKQDGKIEIILSNSIMRNQETYNDYDVYSKEFIPFVEKTLNEKKIEHQIYRDYARAIQNGTHECGPMSIYNSNKEFFKAIGVDWGNKQENYHDFLSKLYPACCFVYRASVIFESIMIDKIAACKNDEVMRKIWINIKADTKSISHHPDMINLFQKAMNIANNIKNIKEAKEQVNQWIKLRGKFDEAFIELATKIVNGKSIEFASLSRTISYSDHKGDLYNATEV